MTKAQIMQLAHSIAKQLVGDYRARMALALRQAWAQAKQPAPVVIDQSELGERIVSALKRNGFFAKYENNYGDHLVHVSRKLSRGWQRMGDIQINEDGSINVNLDRNKAGVRDIAERAIA